MDESPNSSGLDESGHSNSEYEESFDDTDSHYTDVDEGSDKDDSSAADTYSSIDTSDDSESDEEESESDDDEGDRILVSITKPYPLSKAQDTVEKKSYDKVLDSEWGNLKAMIMLADGQQIAEWFSKRNISPEAKENISKVFSPLNLAARVSSPQIFNFFLGEGFPLNTIIHPFLDASLNHKFDIMQKLLDNGADVNVTDAAATTALHLVARQATCKPKKIRYLVSNGANIDQKDSSGMTPLHYALAMGSRNSVVTLVKAGASVNEKNESGRPTLHMAVHRGHKIASYLYKAGARPGTSKTHSEVSLALKLHDLSTLRFLLKVNAPLQNISSMVSRMVSCSDITFVLNALDLLLDVGYAPAVDSVELEMKEDERILLMVQRLKTLVCTPRSLQDLNCFKIRDVLRESSVCIHEAVQQCPLPDILRDYLLLKHIL